MRSRNTDPLLPALVEGLSFVHAVPVAKVSAVPVVTKVSAVLVAKVSAVATSLLKLYETSRKKNIKKCSNPLTLIFIKMMQLLLERFYSGVQLKCK